MKEKIDRQAQLLASGRVYAPPKPVLRRLLTAMAVLLTLLLVEGYWLLLDAHNDRLRNTSLMAKQQAVGDLHQKGPTRPVSVGGGYGHAGARGGLGLAIVDMQMPGMDGAAVGRAIKANEAIADTHLVMLTSLRDGDMDELRRLLVELERRFLHLQIRMESV